MLDTQQQRMYNQDVHTVACIPSIGSDGAVHGNLTTARPQRDWWAICSRVEVDGLDPWIVFFGLGRLGIVLAERHTGPPFQGMYVRPLEAPYPCIIFEPAAHSSPCVASRLFVSWKEDTHSQTARATRQQSSIISSVFCSSRRPMHPGLLHIHRGEYTIMNHSSEINRRSMAMAIANPPSSADNASATNLKTLAAGGG